MEAWKKLIENSEDDLDSEHSRGKKAYERTSNLDKLKGVHKMIPTSKDVGKTSLKFLDNKKTATTNLKDIENSSLVNSRHKNQSKFLSSVFQSSNFENPSSNKMSKKNSSHEYLNRLDFKKESKILHGDKDSGNIKKNKILFLSQIKKSCDFRI